MVCKSMLNASDFKAKPDLKKIINFLVAKFNFKEIKYLQHIKEIIEIIYRKNNIEIIENNTKQSLLPEIIFIIINLSSFYYEQIVQISNTYEELDWLNILLTKYLYLVNKLNIFIEKDKILFLLKISDNNIAQIYQINNSEVLLISPQFYKNFPEISSQAWIANNNKIIPVLPKLGDYTKNETKTQIYKIFLYKEDKNDEEEYTLIFPTKLYKSEKKALIYPSYLFRCEKCHDIDYSYHCNVCNREKRILALCSKCKHTRIGMNNECLNCGRESYMLYYVKINLQHTMENYSKKINVEKEKILELIINSNYKNETFLLENLEKGYIRNKYGLKIDPNGACKITIKAAILPSNGEDLIEEDEILIPIEILEKIKRIQNYIHELKREMYKSKVENQDNLYLLLITSHDSLLFYLVKVRGITEGNFVMIHPTLFDKIFSNYMSNKKIYLYLLEDFLLNYSKFYSKNVRTPAFIIINDKSTSKMINLKYKIKYSFEEDFNSQVREIILSNIKLFLMHKIVEKAITNISIGLKCENCGTEYTRIPIFTRCKKCRKKIKYKWNKSPLIPYIKEFEKQIQLYNLLQYIKKVRRPIMRFIEGNFKDYDAYEKLDKFLKFK